MTAIDEVKILRAARALVERGWCQGATARDATGDVVGPGDPTACGWCMTGAVFEATHRGDDGSLACRVMRVLARHVPADVFDWNDDPERTQADVLAAFDRAIDLQEAPTR